MEEERKNTSTGKLILPVVLVAIFAVAIFGAGYAYFAATTSGAANVANVSANIPNGATTTISTLSNTCAISPTSAQMVQAVNNTSVAKSTDDCYLAVTLNGAAGVSCTYDIVLDETSTTDYAITKVNNVAYSGLEFTGTFNVVSGSCTTGQYTEATCTGTWTAASGTNADSVRTGISNTETQMDTLAGSATIGSTTADGLLSKGTIEVATDNTPVTHYYTLTEKWYNIPADQAAHSDKLYTYDLKAVNILC